MSVDGVRGSTVLVQAPFLNVRRMLEDLSRAQQAGLERRLKEVVSNRLGDALDNRPKYSSDGYAKGYAERIGPVEGVIATSLKDEFLSTPLFISDIVIDFWSAYSKIARGESFTYTLEALKVKHVYLTSIITSTPNLDPLIQDQLRAAVENDKNYVLGFELDRAETQKQQQIVFSIFEKDGEQEISRIQVPASTL